MNLTPRQLDVLALLASGHKVPDIARALHVTENSVKTHTKGLFRRLGVHTAPHAVAVAYERGILVSRQLDSARAWAVELEQELAHLREAGCLPTLTTSVSVDIGTFARRSGELLEGMSEQVRQQIRAHNEASIDTPSGMFDALVARNTSHQEAL